MLWAYFGYGLLSIILLWVLLRHQQKMAAIRSEHSIDDVVKEIAAMRAELRELKLTLQLQHTAVGRAVDALRVPPEETYL